MTQDPIEIKIRDRIDGITNWLSENAPYVAVDQKHLDAGTPERAYWHYGYLMALKDTIQQTQSGRQFMTENKEAFEGLAERKENKGKWIPIGCFHVFKPLFYVGHDGIIDNSEVYKYKGYIPKQVEWFLPLDEIEYSDLME